MCYGVDGKPIDKSYLECGLPEFLQESLDKMKNVWENWDKGIRLPDWDCSYCSLQSDINSAEVNDMITEEQAWYLREKYLRIERNSDIC